MLKCKYEHCHYPCCNGEDCGMTLEELAAWLVVENMHLRGRMDYAFSTIRKQAIDIERTINASKEEPYIPACPYGCSDCMSDPAYIRHYHNDWWIELGRPTVCKEGMKCYEAGKDCPYYDDEDK